MLFYRSSYTFGFTLQLFQMCLANVAAHTDCCCVGVPSQCVCEAGRYNPTSKS